MSSSSSSSVVAPSSSSSSSSLYSPPPSVQTAAPALTAWKNCIARINQAIQKVRLGIPSENVNLKKSVCTINQDVPGDPVITNCGHLFDRIAIETWRKTNNKCPTCKTQITILSPNYALKELIEDWQQEDPIPTRSNFKVFNKELAKIHNTSAKKCIDAKEYEEAIKCYREALRYTKSTKVYSAIPQLYEKLGKKDKATLSRLYLSLYQVQEGKTSEAAETLKQCGSDTLKLDPLVVGLTLQSSQSLEKIDEALILASKQTDTEDKVFIYKQIIAYAPDKLEAYKQLIPLITDPIEKRSLRLKAADLANKAGLLELEKSYRSEAEIPLVSTVITKAGWANAKTINLPPYPQALKDFLNEDDPIFGGKRKDNHIVVPLFPMVDIDGIPVPSTLDSLDKLDKSSGGPGCKYIWDKIPKDTPAEKEFHWAVLTNDVLPGSRNKSYEKQLKLLPHGYEMPGVFDAARAILWENRHSGKKCFSYNPWTYIRCKGSVDGLPLAAGGFAPAGLFVGNGYGDDDGMGVAGWRKF